MAWHEELAVDPRWRHRIRGQLACDLVVDRPFPAGQVRSWPGRRGADERSVGVVREHFHLAPAGDLGGAADVIAVKGAALAR
jgi:hypothetical protein